MRSLLVTLALALVALGAGPAAAQQLIATYVAQLSQRDHFNSNGVRLTSAAAIIRQDRANYHRFGIRDAADEWDPVFASANNRARMEALLNGGNSSPIAIQAIVNGTPFVVVQVWGNGGVITYVDVEIQ